MAPALIEPEYNLIALAQAHPASRGGQVHPNAGIQAPGMSYNGSPLVPRTDLWTAEGLEQAARSPV